MPWNSTSPTGTLSVKDNKSPMQQNTAYIETTMNLDHYWNIGSDEDGRHKYINMKNQDPNPSISTNFNGVLFLKETTDTKSQLFYKNSSATYQLSPGVLNGTTSLTGSYSTVVAIPANTYGEIIMYVNSSEFPNDTGKYTAQSGFFRSTSTLVEAWSHYLDTQGDGDPKAVLKFGNGSTASGLNFRARTDEGLSGTYSYKITYRDR